MGYGTTVYLILHDLLSLYYISFQTSGVYTYVMCHCRSLVKILNFCVVSYHVNIFFMSIEMCTALEDPDNGVVMFESTNVGSSAQYVCNEGFLLLGGGVRMCEAGGMWSGSEPVCEQGVLLLYTRNGYSTSKRKVFQIVNGHL